MKKRNVGAVAHGCQKNKGITLIALVITIIIMLILVMVTVSYGVKSGLFGKAKYGTSRYQYEEEEDEIGQIRLAYKVDEETDNTNGKGLLDYLVAELSGKAEVTQENEDEIIIIYNKTGNEHIISNDKEKIDLSNKVYVNFNKGDEYKFLIFLEDKVIGTHGTWRNKEKVMEDAICNLNSLESADFDTTFGLWSFESNEGYSYFAMNSESVINSINSDIEEIKVMKNNSTDLDYAEELDEVIEILQIELEYFSNSTNGIRVNPSDGFYGYFTLSEDLLNISDIFNMTDYTYVSELSGSENVSKLLQILSNAPGKP